MNTKEYVEYLLKNYYELKQDLKFLKYELEMFEGITGEESIDALNFKKAEGETLSMTNVPTDKTGKIALGYNEYMDRMNMLGRREIALKIQSLEYELNYLSHCVSRLEPKPRKVMELIYFEKQPWMDIANACEVTVGAVGKIKKQSESRVCKFYEAERPGIEMVKVGKDNKS